MEPVKSKPSVLVSGVISAAILALTLLPGAFPENHSWQVLDRQVFPVLLLPGRFLVAHLVRSTDPWPILLLNWIIYAVLLWPLTGDFAAKG
jgi:hypothetical protein